MQLMIYLVMPTHNIMQSLPSDLTSASLDITVGK